MSSSLSTNLSHEGEHMSEGTENAEKVEIHCNDDAPVASASHLPYFKYASLVLLVLHHVIYIILLSYVRTTSGPRFIKSTFVFVCEIEKAILSCILVCVEEKSVMGALKTIHQKILRQPYETLKMSIPALIYTLQNNLSVVAISNLDPATFVVSSQLKIFTTAVFTMLILHRRLGLTQWSALIVLFAGISLVQIAKRTSTSRKEDTNVVVGLLAVITVCICSGLAGVYLEKVYKGSEISLFVRNIQLSILSMAFGSLTVYIWDGIEVRNRSFFYGYTNLVWLCTVIQSFGGLLIAYIIKYADNILKSFATSFAIILSCIARVILFHFRLSVLFAFGGSLVAFAILLYSNVEFILSRIRIYSES